MAIDKINIKYNNPVMDQENIEKIANKVNEIIDEPAGTEVEANVQLVGDESNLSSIQIGDNKYKVSQVDPSTSQTYDEEIDKLKIDGTIYKVGGGQPLYVHTINFAVPTIATSNQHQWKISLITPQSTPITTKSMFKNALAYYTYYSTYCHTKLDDFYVKYDSDNKVYNVYGYLYCNTSTNNTKLAMPSLKISLDSNGGVTNIVYDLLTNDNLDFDLMSDIVKELK